MLDPPRKKNVYDQTNRAERIAVKNTWSKPTVQLNQGYTCDDVIVC